MRVVAGRWRGRRLTAPRGDATRPTTDRVKEALFSILGERVAGGRVVDLCCGSGGLGVEALSRGAAEVVFVDRGREALSAARRNLELCRAEPERYRLVREDALAWLSALPASERFDLALADPPYAGETPALIWEALSGHAEAGRLDRAVLEHRPDLETPDPAAGWRIDRRVYGASALSILERCDD